MWGEEHEEREVSFEPALCEGSREAKRGETAAQAATLCPLCAGAAAAAFPSSGRRAPRDGRQRLALHKRLAQCRRLAGRRRHVGVTPDDFVASRQLPRSNKPLR
jgi:hypothetical protein